MPVHFPPTRAALYRIVLFLSVAIVLFATGVRAQSPQGSRVFEPDAASELSHSEDEFRGLNTPHRSLVASDELLHRLENENASELSDAFARLLSVSLFDRGHLGASVELLRRASHRQPPTQHHAESQLLSVLLSLSSGKTTRQECSILDAELAAICSSDLAEEPLIEGEYFYWRAEVLRSLDEHRAALEYYDSTLALKLPPMSYAHVRYRKAELEEHILLSEEARRDYDSVAALPQPNPFRLLAMLRSASMLRAQGRYELLGERVDAIARLLADTTSRFDHDIENGGYRSLFLPLLRDPSLRQERISSRAERGMTDSVGSALFAPQYPNVYECVLRASVYSSRRAFDSTVRVLDLADTILARPDSNNADLQVRTYLHHLVEFERGWAALENGDNTRAATLFRALADDDSLSNVISKFSRPLVGYTGTFYNDADALRGVQASPALAAPTEHVYDDIPSRARFYAGIALFRAGKFESARDILTALSQDETAIYSDKARYHLALVEFTSNHTIAAEALLEPVATRRTRAGIYSAILLGDINYRKMNFARAAEYFGFALSNLSSYDTALIALSSLERGLSLVALGGWHDAVHDLGEFVLRANLNSPGLDEGLFWYGRALLRVDSVEPARIMFKRVLDEFPSSERRIDAEYGYAWSLFRAGEYVQADRSFERVMKLDSITRYAYDALSRRGDAEYAAGHLSKAVKIYNLAVDRPTFDDYRTARSMFQLGIIRMRSDSARSAINAFQYVVNKVPQTDLLDRCYYNIAVAAYAIKQNERANEAAATIYKKYRSSPFAAKVAYLQAGQRERGGDLAGAYVAYRRIVREYPASPEYVASIFGAIGALASLERYPEAIALADSMYKKNADAAFAPGLLYRKGEVEFEAERFESARTTFEQFAKRYERDTLFAMARLMTARSIIAGKGSHDDARAILADVTLHNAASMAASMAYLELARLAKKDEQKNVATYYTNAFDMRYYSSDAAPQAMYEYAVYVRDGMHLADSSNAIFDELTRRYLIQTNIGARAQLQVASSLINSGEHAKAITRLETVAAAHTGDAIGAGATLDLADQYVALGNHAKALAVFDHSRDVFDLTGDQLGRSYLGSARAQVKLAQKKKAIATLHAMLKLRGIPSSKREQAQALLQTLAPVKKKKKHK
ncbi:MAG: tetratricopeptide repeat protein [Bacteroidetes bacterium]|nr:tetratricopeptide repeat protein [Bacteroidota bacterium]